MLYFVVGENEYLGSGIGGDENKLERFDNIEKAKRSKRGASCTSNDRGELFVAALPPPPVNVVRKPPGPKVNTAEEKNVNVSKLYLGMKD